jgi:predicted nucleotidyltransferase
MIRNNIKERVKEYFFTNPTAKMRVRQLERDLKLSLPSVIRFCKELKMEGILNTVKIGNVLFYAADRTNKNFLFEKKLFNLKKIHYSGIIDHIRTELSNPPIVLFGSYSKGEDIEDSDVDLYLETPSNKNIDLSEFEKKIDRKVQLFKFKNIREVPNVHLANNIINGIVLNNYVEVFK